MQVIQVGMGGMGDAWLRAVLASPEVEHVAFVEVSSAIAREQAEKHGLHRVPVFSSLSDALAAVPAQGVINVTPPQFHRPVSMTALEAGLPVLSEKPLADSMEAAADIVRRANETGLLHMVAQNRRYTPVAQTIKSVLAAGQLGRVASVSVEFFRGPHFGGFREEMAHPLIVDMSIHHFDMMRFFLDSDALSIFARSWNPPWSWYRGDACGEVSLRFASGAVISYVGSWCSLARETSWNAHWRFEGERGVLVAEHDQVWLELAGEKPQLVPAVSLQRTEQAYLLHEFYRAVAEGAVPATTCQDNIRSLGIVFDALSSIESGEVIGAS